MSLPNLPLADMSARHSGLTPAVASYYYEGARVCLDRHHTSPVAFDLVNDGRATRTEVEWIATDQACRDAWANEIDTTEAGAYACVLAAGELLRGYFAVRRAEVGTGADYYVGPPGSGTTDLEDCLRLEVSGMDHGSESMLDARLREKVLQAGEGRSNLPALAGVVGFLVRRILLADVREAA